MSSRKSNSEANGKGRTRNYTTVVYPESAPKDWLRILAEEKVPAFVSPLHDKDINFESESKELKKAHYHVMICFDSVKTKDQAREIFSKIGGVGCEAVNSIRGCARYLCHLDNPDKEQYSIDDVVQLCGADYASTIDLPTDKYKAIGEMLDWCDENQTTSYAELLTFARVARPDWFRVLCDSATMVMKEFLKSREWENQKKLEQLHTDRLIKEKEMYSKLYEAALRENDELTNHHTL